MYKKEYLPWVIAAGFAVSLVAVSPVFAAGQPGGGGGWGGGFGMHGASGAIMPGVFGTVSAVNGTTLTVTGKTRPTATTSATAVTYTIDASNAKVMKNGTSSTVSAIATGDMVMAQGTVTGTNVVATVIRDGMGGMMGGHGMPGMEMGRGQRPSSTAPVSPIQGNGQPVVGGSITSINGTTLIVTNTSNVTYTIDATNAKIVKNGTTTAISNLATGDSVIVQGTVNGTSVTASSVIDQGGSAQNNQGQAGGTTVTTPSTNSHPGFFGAIGGFFKHIFGF